MAAIEKGTPLEPSATSVLKVWPDGPVPGVYVTTSQRAIDAAIARYEAATDGALLYAEDAGRSSDAAIDLGEHGLFSRGMDRLPSGTLVVVGPVPLTQESWSDNKDRLNTAANLAYSSSLRVVVLAETPLPGSKLRAAIAERFPDVEALRAFLRRVLYGLPPGRSMELRDSQGRTGEWRRVSYAEALQTARRIGQALLNRGLSAEHPVVILSENSLEHALLAFEIVGEPERDTAGAILGYPGNGPFSARAARIGDTSRVVSEDAYGRGPVERDMTVLRGRVKHGNSGGPVVDRRGRVLTTVFAEALGDGPPSGYGVPNAVVRRALAQAHRRTRSVSTGPCTA